MASEQTDTAGEAVATPEPPRRHRRTDTVASRPSQRPGRPPVVTPDSHSLVAHFRQQVEIRGDHAALYRRDATGWTPITWERFGQLADNLACWLVTQGIQPQQHVAIWSNNRPEWHIADIAIMQVRARPVPVYLTLSADQAAYVLSHSESRIVVVEDIKLLAKVLSIRDQLPSLERVVILQGPVPEGSPEGLVVAWEDVAVDADESVRRLLRERIAAVEMNDVATLIYTSGTTGPPKAVTLTHANICACAAALATFIEVGENERVLSYLPLAHVAERMVSEFRSYMYGNPTYFLDGIENLGERLKEVRPNQFFAVPRVWEKMALKITNSLHDSPRAKRTLAEWALGVGAEMAAVEAAGGTPGGWLRRRFALADHLVLSKVRHEIGLDEARIVASGAAPISTEVLRLFRSIGLEICEVYGQTEDCAMTTMNRPGLSRIGTVGTRLPGIEVSIAADGEILVRGGNVFSGYYKDDEATGDTLIDGWLHTGDVGDFDSDGYLRITDRKKDLIITAGGKNIAPSNIEGLLKEHPLIGNAVVIGDRRPFVTALLTLDPEEAARFAAAHDMVAQGAELAGSDAVHQVISAHVNVINEKLNHVEQVKKWTMLEHDFAVGDELTPTLKVKRKVVAEKYAQDIEALYRR